MSDWVMRPAEPRDADGLTECVVAAYEKYVPRMDKPPGPMLADYTEEIARHQVWVAEADGQIIGGLVLIPYEDYLLLDNIAVHPSPIRAEGSGRPCWSWRMRKPLCKAMGSCGCTHIFP